MSDLERRAVREVFPTRVGVDLLQSIKSDGKQSFPHTRGGGPKRYGVTLNEDDPFSPHAWGWT